MLNKFILWFSWVHAAIGAGAVTISILSWPFLRSKGEAGNANFLRENPAAILWIFAGTFFAIMIVVGLIDASINGYGTGEIF